MRIGFDARCLEENKISGVGEYSLELLRNILETEPPRPNEKKDSRRYIIFSNSFKQQSKNHLGWLAGYPHIELKRFRYPNKILNLFFWYLNWPKIDKMIGGVDIFFAPNINFISVSRDCRLIITFHDLSFERYPDFFPLKTRLWHKYFVNPRKLARTAEKIIAVSDSTKNDLEEIYGIKPENIKTIPHGISPKFRKIDGKDSKLLAIKKKYNLPNDFILFLGNIEPRKNISSIVTSYINLGLKNPKLAKYKLVLAGNVSPLCQNLINKENIATCGYIEGNDRPYIYNLASLLVYPSYFEGFGLPVLEAMACGTPVIASNNSSIPEVAGPAAILVDPNRPSEITIAIEALLTDDKLYHRMKERGIKQSQTFSWKKCALELTPAFSDQLEKDLGDTHKN